MELWKKLAVGGGAALGAFGVFTYFSSPAKAAAPTASKTDAGKAGYDAGCKQGTADGKTGVESLNPTDVTTNPALAAAAKASGDAVTFLSEYDKGYQTCFASTAPKKPTPSGSTTAKVTMDCAVMTTWPADVQSLWTEFQAHKSDPATSAYAISGKATTLYGKFLSLGCSGNAKTVQNVIQHWIDTGGTVTGGPDCKVMSTWPAATAAAYKLYLADPRGYVDSTGGADLVAALNAIGCSGTAAAVQHTIDLEMAAGNIHTGALEKSKGCVSVGWMAHVGVKGRKAPKRLYKGVRVGQTMARDHGAIALPSKGGSKPKPTQEIIYASY